MTLSFVLFMLHQGEMYDFMSIILFVLGDILKFDKIVQIIFLFFETLVHECKKTRFVS